MTERLSNLDMADKLVRRGVIVSYHGLRLYVVRVSRGFFWGRVVATYGISRCEFPNRLKCECVQVVAPVSRKAAPPVSRVGAKGAALPLCN